ncbi:MAG: hypothetical protein A2Z85_04635 [Chlamydiae bacterium GWA2_50_15]|nr:MAG: hypothetical protein A2Z85_04635 [Chlamydiae bacterium GWA2_50_15]
MVLIFQKESEAPSVDRLAPLVRQLCGARRVQEKAALLSRFSQVQKSFQEFLNTLFFPKTFRIEEEVILKALIALGQQEVLRIYGKNEERLSLLFETLSPVDAFYEELGGLVGYHFKMLTLLSKKEEQGCEKQSLNPFERRLSPPLWQLTEKNLMIRKAILEGILRLPEIGEIYPLGGAGDRLSLIDDETKEPLPAAVLPFLGKTLLQGLIEDVQAREYLYFKLRGRKIITNIAIMTSHEKQNHRRILELFERAGWFGRPKESFFFFSQPLVPVINAEGKWCFEENERLFLKPGGHGVLWKLAQQQGVFDWFQKKGVQKALVRQVNNPVAGCDYGLLALAGIGLSRNKTFGSAACPRLVGSQEGTSVVRERIRKGGFSYSLAPIEYCVFKEHGVIDESEEEGGVYSKYPSNTNILFVDLPAIRRAINKSPIPGMLVNPKRAVYFDGDGQKREGRIARLECTMQNISEQMESTFSGRLEGSSLTEMSSFLTYNQRRKTISCTKRKYGGDGLFLETPEGAFLDVLNNAYELLTRCNCKVPKPRSPKLFFERGPSFLFFYLSALGPLFSIIAQKLKGGKLLWGSELDLHIADVELENVTIKGSVLLHAEDENKGAAQLSNAMFVNEGIDFRAPNLYWKKEIQYKERFEIILEGAGFFVAEDVHFRGGGRIIVPDGMRLIAQEKRGELFFIKEKRDPFSGNWHYTFTDHAKIELSKLTKS